MEFSWIEVEVRVRFLDELRNKAGGAVGGMFGSAGDQMSAPSPYTSIDRRGRAVEAYPHRERERQSHRVVARSQVRRGRRDADGNHRADISIRPAIASKVASVPAPASSTRERITSGSFSPWPVSTLTTVPSGPTASRSASLMQVRRHPQPKQARRTRLLLARAWYLGGKYLLVRHAFDGAAGLARRV